MRYMSLNEIREKYLSFFESKGHLRMKSFPLVPINDNSLLLINSGMAPLKKFFTGEEIPPRKRVTTCQKCIRTPDLERVGHTARHGTFFEMLGNFSFGDYFKREAIEWAWEFLTKVMEIPEELLWASVYESDDEAYAIWRDVIGIPEKKIVRLGKEDNFWEHGVGPCGPCSEIYFDRGEKYGCGSPDCKPGCDCDRYMEIWNNVFSQFNNDGKGNYTELATKNIDTGMGLERLACVMQNVDNMFEVDTVRKILDAVCSVCGKKYGENASFDVSIRIITDHIRSASFMISDGVSPSNEGRGYVLRRLLRRAARHGKLLGVDKSFLSDLCDVVIEQSGGAYNELVEKKDYIKKVVSLEEERFKATIDAGLNILSNLIDKTKKDGGGILPGEDVFKLYDTFGFPIDLTREIAEEAGLSVDDSGFEERMIAQRERARQARGNISGWSENAKSALGNLPKTEFTGYTNNTADAVIEALISDDGAVEKISEGEFTLVLSKTPFYGEGGGQVGDIGEIISSKGSASVIDTKKTDGVYLHICRMTGGVFSVGDTVKAKIDSVRRDAVRRNHSAAHLLQSALRLVLGNHVEQAGSYVDDSRVRFDFRHFSPMTPEQIEKTEAFVNEAILSGASVDNYETSIEDAKKSGAIALFGEKYGQRVRVVKMGNWSIELCGGTHVSNTAKIGLFKIISESSVAAGIRRIEGTTGLGVLTLMEERDNLIKSCAKELKVGNFTEIDKKAAALQSELRDAKQEIEKLNSRLAESQTGNILSAVRKVGKFDFIAYKTDGVDISAVRNVTDRIKKENENSVVLISVSFGGKLNLVAACGAAAVRNGANAGTILKEISPIAGGGGGGRPDSAVSGIKDADKLDAVFKKAEEILVDL